MTFNIANLNDRTVRDYNSRELGEPTEDECDTQALSQDKVVELASLPKLEYERQRIAAAKAMGVRISALDDAVESYRRARSVDETPAPANSQFFHLENRGQTRYKISLRP